jgi:hypothetical protein
VQIHAGQLGVVAEHLLEVQYRMRLLCSSRVVLDE